MEILDSHDSATYDLVIAGDSNINVNDESNAEVYADESNSVQ